MNHPMPDYGMVDRERGAMALIATIIIAVLISVITAGLSRGFSSEFRQTTDVQNSDRAFYAAEAGVEDALQRIKDNSDPLRNPSPYYYTETPVPGDPQGASRADATGQVIASPLFRHIGPGNDLTASAQADDPGAKWIYRSIKLVDQQSEGALKRDQSVQVDFSRAGLSKLVIEWNDAVVDSGKQGSWLTGFPSNWAASQEPAAMQLNLASWAEGGGVVTSFAPSVTYLGRPCQSRNIGPGPAPVLPSCALDGAGQDVTFNAARQYRLRWEIPLDQGSFYVARLRAKFTGTHYRVTAYDTAGAPVVVPDKYITIDVTGKAGETYRRLVVKKQYQADIFSIFDFALASEQDLCKSFSVYADFSLDHVNC
jgi:hypothetical protein